MFVNHNGVHVSSELERAKDSKEEAIKQQQQDWNILKKSSGIYSFNCLFKLKKPIQLPMNMLFTTTTMTKLKMSKFLEMELSKEKTKLLPIILALLQGNFI